MSRTFIFILIPFILLVACTAAPTATPTPTNTPLPTATPQPTNTPLPTSTATVTTTSVPIATPTATATATNTLTRTRTPTVMPVETYTNFIEANPGDPKYVMLHQEGATVTTFVDPQLGLLWRASCDGSPDLRRGYASYGYDGIEDSFSVELKNLKVETIDPAPQLRSSRPDNRWASVLGGFSSRDGWKLLFMVDIEPGIGGQRLVLKAFDGNGNAVRIGNTPFEFGKFYESITVKVTKDNRIVLLVNGEPVTNGYLPSGSTRKLESLHAGLYGNFARAIFINGSIIVRY